MQSLFAQDPDEVIRLARCEGSPARGWLFERHRGLLTRLAAAQIGPRLRGKLDPTDLVQETFLRAHREFARFRGTSAAELASWLREILTTTVAMAVRHYYGARRRDVRRERPLSDLTRRPSRLLDELGFACEETPVSRVLHDEQCGLMMEALGRLPEGHREAVILRHLEDLHFAEVATRMSRSVGAVKKLSTRGLATLRRELARDE